MKLRGESDKEKEMSKLLSIFKHASKRTQVTLAIALAVVAIPATLFAWGPDRPTYTMNNPADHVTFNSITDNPNYGDERNFVTIKDASDRTAGGWVDEIDIKSGKEYYVRMYVHNNAAENLNLVANNVTANFNLPDYKAKRIQIDGYLSSTNAEPSKIWDQAVFTNSDNFSLKYIKGSASYTNNVFTDGIDLSDDIISSGVKLGYRSLNGDIQGCMQYTGLVIFKVKAEVADYKIDKTVRINGSSDKTFRESVDAKAGDLVDFQIHFENTGDTDLQDVVIKDSLPKGLSYVKDSTYVAINNDIKKISDGITDGGYVINRVDADGGDVYIKFTAKVDTNESLPKCGDNSLVNTAKATTSDGSKTDTAKVIATKTCDTKEVCYTCDRLSVEKISKNSFRFNTEYTTENATFKSVKYVIYDANGKTIDTKTSTNKTLDYVQNSIGKYTVQATIVVTVDGKDKTVTSEGCKTSFEVTAEEIEKTPEQLPTTGIGDDTASLLGIGAIVTAAGYYIASRRMLTNK